MADLRLNRWRVQDGDHSAGLLLGFPRARLVAVLGWGWDEEHPLRPWPWLTTTPTRGGHPGFCVSWCGFFLNVRHFRQEAPRA